MNPIYGGGIIESTEQSTLEWLLSEVTKIDPKSKVSTTHDADGHPYRATVSVKDNRGAVLASLRRVLCLNGFEPFSMSRGTHFKQIQVVS